MYHSVHNQPAFPVPDGDDPGITVWQYYRAAALQGLLSNCENDLDPEEIAVLSARIADEAIGHDETRNQEG